MILFSVASLTPAALIALATLSGGGWALALLAYMAVFVPLLDLLVAGVTPPAEAEEFPAANALSVALALAHFAGLALAVWALSGPMLTLLEKVALFAGAGLWFGQVSNSNAHELIHRGGRALHRLGVAVYVSLLFGHHASAHVLVHHVRVATPDDPNSARLGEGFYRFALRAWIGSFRDGRRAETARMARAGRSMWRHPYLVYIGGALATCAIAIAIGGVGGLLALLCLAGYAQMQLLMSDYVQHYGLSRVPRADGKPEPVGDRHSWNSPHWYSSALMLNAPRHSDHHARPARPYPALELTDGPQLPRSLPVMAVLALWPRKWRQVMDRRVAQLSAHSES
ncbi:alkane 1-monooxygenase [Loktanella sp. IMCC34160]|uniref:alkane 1-monooxygenase n=1 Tax=Loktanella sp. IMCC34160 TaxID=2510646 RepID=UPI00101B9346|nr:alkane 1-monooxygenase [Loktanella sp. IMCC34160]RYG90900.1 alkane 1-monooxygenase [Loktanella sp. IMCC34160]